MNSSDSLAQAAVLRGLLAPDCYPHAADRIEWIETHISTVLLVGDYAYKFKKPVNLGFLDFTTLELRRHYCQEELRLNRRLAPRLYLDVVAIIGSPDGPLVGSFEAPGAMEYAVRMRRFAQSALLDHMLASGELTAQYLDTLAAVVAAFHARIALDARTCADDATGAYGTAASVEIPMRQNFSQIRPLLASDEEIGKLDRLEEWSLAMHAALAPCMDRRKRAGFVRECHGDLHLGNIIWSEGEVQIFDCIEFSPGLRWIDVASEVAFTVMDLISRGRPDWGARFLNAYLEITGDYGALHLLPYYLVYRAMVRAKVARIRATQGGNDVCHKALADYAGHIRLAASFTTSGQAALIITRGVSGTGKTTVSQPLLEQLGAIRLRSDVVRKRLHGLQREGRSASSLGAGLYTAAASLDTYAELLRLAALALEAGYPVIVDATFLQRSQRAAFHAKAKEMSLPFLILDCRAAPDELRRRVAERQSAGQDASEATLAVLDWQVQNDEMLDPEERGEAIDIDTQRIAPADLVAMVRQRLRS